MTLSMDVRHRTAATRIGLTLADYERELAAGKKWCVGHRGWHPRSEFGHDKSRSDGLHPRCRVWRKATNDKERP